MRQELEGGQTAIIVEEWRGHHGLLERCWNVASHTQTLQAVREGNRKHFKLLGFFFFACLFFLLSGAIYMVQGQESNIDSMNH